MANIISLTVFRPPQKEHNKGWLLLKPSEVMQRKVWFITVICLFFSVIKAIIKVHQLLSRLRSTIQLLEKALIVQVFAFGIYFF